MSSPSAAEAALKLEIVRLTGAIQQAKSGETSSAYYGTRTGNNIAVNPSHNRTNIYVNPNYKPSNRGHAPATTYRRAAPRQPAADLSQKDVLIGGVTFQSSGRSLVRKDLAKPSPAPLKAGSVVHPAAHPRAVHRPYKPKSSRGRPTRPVNRNMSLNNQRRPYQSRKVSNKRLKYLDKPCPRFTTTGTCSRGLTCPYQHEPDKIAICWKFLQGNCPNTAATCNLSHDPIPERTPLCVHFANNGRCTRDGCLYPHVRVGARVGVCRDFAVLGYCAQGLDCAHQHVRECPDFAEKGACTTRGCKLPHVIRANRGRKVTTMVTTPGTTDVATSAQDAGVGANDGNSGAKHNYSLASAPRYFAEDAKLGDEYISLTFHESEESEEDDDGDDGEEGEEEGEEDQQMASDEPA